MSKNPLSIDITDLSTLNDLLALVEEVNITRKPRILTRDSEILAMLIPVEKVVKPKKSKQKKQTDSLSLLALAGSLKGLIDAETLKKDIYESRRLSTRPSVEL